MQKVGWIWCNGRCLSPGRLTTNERLMKLYDDGTDRLDTELGVERILKHLRDLRIYVNHNLLDEQAKFNIQHNFKNVIDVEKSTDEEGEDEDEDDD